MEKRVLAFVALGLAASAQAADPAKYMRAEIVAETTQPKAGSTILVGFRMTPQPGWHGYWRNPGESGVAPSVRWNLPSGVTVGRLLHPAPTLLLADGLSSFVHAGPHVLLAHVRVPRSLASGTAIPLKAELDWAACTATQCVPLHQTFVLELVGGDGRPSADAGSLLRAEAKVPRSGFQGTFSVDGKNLQLVVPAGLRLEPRNALFFPDDNGAFKTAQARSSLRDGAVTIVGPATGVPKPLSGVVSDGTAAYRVVFTPTAVLVPASHPEGTAKAVAGRELAEADRAEAGRSGRPAVVALPLGRHAPHERGPLRHAWPWAALAAAASLVLLAAAALMRRS